MNETHSLEEHLCYECIHSDVCRFEECSLMGNVKIFRVVYECKYFKKALKQ